VRPDVGTASGASGRTRLVGLLGHPVSDSLSPRMQNAAFAARGLDWAYVPCDVTLEAFEPAVRGFLAAGFAGANVTAPYKLAAAALAETDLPSVNTLVFQDGRIRGFSTDAAVLAGLPAERPAVLGDGGAAAAFREALTHARSFSRRGQWPPEVDDADLVVNATSERDDVLVEVGAGQTLVDLPYPETATARAARERGAQVVGGLEVLVAQGAAAFELWTGVPAPVEVMRRAVGIACDADLRMPGSARHPSDTTGPPD
jgi:shikimate dehydrogenase